MFGKLLKYELKATAPPMLLLNGIALLIGISFWGAWILVDKTPIGELFPNITPDIAEKISILSFGILLIASVTIITVFLSCINPILLFPFYKRRFTQKGHLTFTLPVKASQDFWAALTVILFWNVVGFFVLYLSFTLSYSLYDRPFFGVSWSYFTDLFVTTPSRKLDADDWFGILSVVSVFLYRTVAGMTAVVVAGNYLRRAKAVGMVVLYAAFRLPVILFLLLTDLSRSVQYVPATDFLVSFGFQYPLSAITNDLYPFYSIVLLVLTLIFCFMSIHIMKKRLNLE